MSTASASTSSSPEAAANGEEVPNGVNGNEDPKEEVDIVINNVVGSFSVKCHLNLRDIALRGHNVEYRRENGVRSASKNCKPLLTAYARNIDTLNQEGRMRV